MSEDTGSGICWEFEQVTEDRIVCVFSLLALTSEWCKQYSAVIDVTLRRKAYGGGPQCVLCEKHGSVQQRVGDAHPY